MAWNPGVDSEVLRILNNTVDVVVDAFSDQPWYGWLIAIVSGAFMAFIGTVAFCYVYWGPPIPALRRFIDRLLEPDESDIPDIPPRFPVHHARASANSPEEAVPGQIAVDGDRLRRRLNVYANDITPGRRPYHYPQLLNDPLNPQTWQVMDPSSRATEEQKATGSSGRDDNANDPVQRPRGKFIDGRLPDMASAVLRTPPEQIDEDDEVMYSSGAGFGYGWKPLREWKQDH